MVIRAAEEQSAPSAPMRTALVLAIAATIGAADALAQSSEAALRAELRERDQLIADLVKRVENLERRVSAGDAAGEAVPPRAASTAAEVEPAPRAASEPGALDVDELAAERALERTLTAEGVLLLPKGQWEVEPFFSYARRETERPALIVTPTTLAPATAEIRRNEYDAGLRAKVGLPFDAQLELELPYRVVNQKRVLPEGSGSFIAPQGTGSSFGDIRVGFSKTLLRERGWLPDLVGRVVWDSDTGSRTDDDIGLGIGFNELRVGLSALKRQDPLAFSIGVSYETTFERGGVEPGDELALTLGTSLAVSPETALSVALAQSFAEETKVNGVPLRDSSQVSSTLFFGASSLLSRNALLSVAFGVGLTEGAPDYTVSASIPFRF